MLNEPSVFSMDVTNKEISVLAGFGYKLTLSAFKNLISFTDAGMAIVFNVVLVKIGPL